MSIYSRYQEILKEQEEKEKNLPSFAQLFATFKKESNIKVKEAKWLQQKLTLEQNKNDDKFIQNIKNLNNRDQYQLTFNFRNNINKFFYEKHQIQLNKLVKKALHLRQRRKRLEYKQFKASSLKAAKAMISLNKERQIMYKDKAYFCVEKNCPKFTQKRPPIPKLNRNVQIEKVFVRTDHNFQKLPVFSIKGKPEEHMYHNKPCKIKVSPQLRLLYNTTS